MDVYALTTTRSKLSIERLPVTRSVLERSADPTNVHPYTNTHAHTECVNIHALTRYLPSPGNHTSSKAGDTQTVSDEIQPYSAKHLQLSDQWDPTDATPANDLMCEGVDFV